MLWAILLPFVTVTEMLCASSVLSVKAEKQQGRSHWAETLIWTEEWEAWPDPKASPIEPKPQVLAEPESCLPRKLGNRQNSVWLKTNTTLVFVIHFCSVHQAAFP